MGRRLTQHHRFPKSRCEEYGIKKDDPRNLKMLPENLHESYERIFNSCTPEEAIARLILDFLPPPTVFDPARIKNKHLRSYIRSLWNQKSNKKIASPHFRCEKCGNKIVPISRRGKILIYNCESCGQSQCFTCMLCGKPGHIEVDGDKDLFICGKCLINIVRKGGRLPKRLLSFYPVLRYKLNRIDLGLD